MKTPKRYEAITQHWMSLNGMECIRYTDYLGIERVKYVSRNRKR